MKTFNEYLALDTLLEQLLLREYTAYQNLDNEKDKQVAMRTFVIAQKKFMLKKIANGEANDAMDAIHKFSAEFRMLYDAGRIDLMTGDVLPEPVEEVA